MTSSSTRVSSTVLVGLLSALAPLFVACGDNLPPPLDAGRDSSVSDVGRDALPGDGGGCPGCIDSAGNCLSGQGLQACGAGGAACMACGMDQECADGECLGRPACDRSNCDGCCMGDTCVEVPDDTACGAGGLECTVCTAPATCNAGVCDLPCDETCDGCCDGGTCIPLDDVDGTMCGADGASCAACGDEESCDAGSCVDVSCATTCAGCCMGGTCVETPAAATCGLGGAACMDCGATGACSAEGMCVVNPDSLWDIVVIDAVVPAADGAGDAWDPFSGLPDPYMVVSVGVGASLATGESTPRNNTLMPAWPEVVVSGVRAGLLLERGVEFSMLDDDFDEDDPIGACTMSSADIRFGATLTHSCPATAEAPGYTARVRFEATP